MTIDSQRAFCHYILLRVRRSSILYHKATVDHCFFGILTSNMFHRMVRLLWRMVGSNHQSFTEQPFFPWAMPARSANWVIGGDNSTRFRFLAAELFIFGLHFVFSNWQVILSGQQRPSAALTTCDDHVEAFDNLMTLGTCFSLGYVDGETKSRTETSRKNFAKYEEPLERRRCSTSPLRKCLQCHSA